MFKKAFRIQLGSIDIRIFFCKNETRHLERIQKQHAQDCRIRETKDFCEQIRSKNRL